MFFFNIGYTQANLIPCLVEKYPMADDYYTYAIRTARILICKCVEYLGWVTKDRLSSWVSVKWSVR